MPPAIAARTGAGSVMEAKTAVHIEATGLEANVGGPGAVQTITNISLASPAVITVTGHNLETGDKINISGTNSTPVINGERTVTVLTANTFTAGINTTGAGTAGTIAFVSGEGGVGLGGERRYYFLVDAPAGTDDGRSHVFAPSADGKHTWDDYIFPQDGSYTIRLRDMLTDQDEATLAVTVVPTA